MKKIIIYSFFILLFQCDNNPIEPKIYGCLDETAINFSNVANIDDGTCIYEEINYSHSEYFCENYCHECDINLYFGEFDSDNQTLEIFYIADNTTINNGDIYLYGLEIENLSSGFLENNLHQGNISFSNDYIHLDNIALSGSGLLTTIQFDYIYDSQAYIYTEFFNNDGEWIQNGECGSIVELGEQDCMGDWGGSAIYDECGVCDGSGAIYECGCSDIGDGECDCDGNVEDQCGVCGGDDSSCAGCDGIANSGLDFDECGICDGDGIADGTCDCDGNTPNYYCWDGSIVCNENDCSVNQVDLNLHTSIGYFNGHAYYVSNSPATWDEANSAAISSGGYIVVINNLDENNYIYNNSGQNHSNGIWMGLTDLQNEGTWITVLGQTIWIGDQDGNEYDNSFNNWAENQPDNQIHNANDQNCAYIIREQNNNNNNYESLWDDAYCWAVEYYVIEIDPNR